MRERRRYPSLVGPLLLITAGVLLLLNQMGKLSWDVGGSLWRFWPVIFILIGLEILVRASRSTALYIMGMLIAIAVLASVIVYAIYQGGQLPVASERPAGGEGFAEAMQDASSGQIKLKLGVALAEISALRDSPNFVEGEIEYGTYSLEAERSFSVSSGRAVLSLRGRAQATRFWWPTWPTERASEHWSLRFTPRIPLEMNVDTGVGKVEMDLNELKVTKLDVNAGVGDVVITLPAEAGQTRATVNAGVGNISVRIPAGVAARIHVSKGLGTIQVRNSRLAGSGNDYVSSNYDAAENRLELDVRGGIGKITIE